MGVLAVNNQKCDHRDPVGIKLHPPFDAAERPLLPPVMLFDTGAESSPHPKDVPMLDAPPPQDLPVWGLIEAIAV